MAVQQTNLKCCSCGSTSFIQTTQSLFKCEYCSSISIIDGLPDNPKKELKEHLLRETRKIETIFKKAANYMHDGISDGGRIHLTKRELVFIPHAFNLNTGYKLVFPFQEIRDMRKRNAWLGLSRQLIIESSDGSESTFIVWGRDEVINMVSKQL